MKSFGLTSNYPLLLHPTKETDSMPQNTISMKLTLLVYLLAISILSIAQELKYPDEMFLWPQGAPGSEPKNYPWENYREEWRTDTVDQNEKVIFVTHPTIRVFLPEPAVNTGAAVVLCPGGGYNILEIEKEGYAVATRLQELGIAAIVLKYRHYSYEAARDDALRAISTVRHNAPQWGINPNAIGIGGFSAGGHLSVNAAANREYSVAFDADSVSIVSNRADFLMIGYGALRNLNKMNVTKDIPPSYLFVAGDDLLAPLVISYYQYVTKLGVPAELHIYQKGGHGFGVGMPECHCTGWIAQFKEWLATNGFLGRQ